jgi:hypothetical protein
MNTGVQFTGTLAPNQTNRWFTFNWNAASHVVWYMMPTTPQGAAEINWSVATQRSDATHTTYWITVTNRPTNRSLSKGRYAILS